MTRCIALALALVACGGDKDATDTADTGTVTTSPTGGSGGPGSATGSGGTATGTGGSATGTGGSGTGTGTATGTGTGGTSAACPDFFPADRVGIQWQFRTEHDDGTVVDWTQEVLPQEAGQFVLQTSLEGTLTDLYYTCGADDLVELHGGDSVGPDFVMSYVYTPAMMVYPGGTPTKGMAWASLGSQSGDYTVKGFSGSFDEGYTAEWTLTGVDLTYDLNGEKLYDCFTFDRSSSTIMPGATVSTEELGIYCGSLYGLVWHDVVTTTTYDFGGPPQVAESVTTLMGLVVP